MNRFFFLFIFVSSPFLWAVVEPREPYRIFREAADYVMAPQENSVPVSFRVEALLNIAKNQQLVGDEAGVQRSLQFAREITDKLNGVEDASGDSYEKNQSLASITAFLSGNQTETEDDSSEKNSSEKKLSEEKPSDVVASIIVNRNDFARSLSTILHTLSEKKKYAEGFLLLQREVDSNQFTVFQKEHWSASSFLYSAADDLTPDQLLAFAGSISHTKLRELLIEESLHAILQKRFAVPISSSWTQLSFFNLTLIELVWNKKTFDISEETFRNLEYHHDFDMRFFLNPSKHSLLYSSHAKKQQEPPPFDPQKYIDMLSNSYTKALFLALAAVELCDTDIAAAHRLLQDSCTELKNADLAQNNISSESLRRHFNKEFAEQIAKEIAKRLVIANALLKAGDTKPALEILEHTATLVQTDAEKTWLAVSFFKAGKKDRYESLRKEIKPQNEMFDSKSNMDDSVTFLGVFATFGLFEQVQEELRQFPREETLRKQTDQKANEFFAQMTSPSESMNLEYWKNRYWREAREKWILPRTRADIVLAQQAVTLFRQKKYEEAWNITVQIYSLLTRLTLLEQIVLEQIKTDGLADNSAEVDKLYEKIVQHAIDVRTAMTDAEKNDLDSNNRNKRFCYVLDFEHPFVNVALKEKNYREVFDRVCTLWRSYSPEDSFYRRVAMIAKSGDYSRAVEHAKVIGYRDLDIGALGYIAARQFDAGLKAEAEQTFSVAISRVGVDSSYKGNSYHYSGNMIYDRPMGFPELVKALVFCDKTDEAVRLTVKEDETQDKTGNSSWEKQRGMVLILETLFQSGQKEKWLETFEILYKTKRLPDYIWDNISRMIQNDKQPQDTVFNAKLKTIFETVFKEIRHEPNPLERARRYAYFEYIYKNTGNTEQFLLAQRLAEESLDSCPVSDFQSAFQKARQYSSSAFYRDNIIEREALYFKAIKTLCGIPRDQGYHYNITIDDPVRSYATALAESRKKPVTASPASPTKQPETPPISAQEDAEKKKWSLFWAESGWSLDEM